MQIYRSLQTNRLTQGFGTNGEWYRANGINIIGHSGLDFSAWSGEPIYHSGDFEGVMKTEIDRLGGIGVDVFSNKPLIDGHRVKLRYWHLKTVIGWDGKKIKPGDLIGLADNTGFSTGDHLHFGLKLIDNNDATVHRTNGYYGAIDPMPYYKNTFIINAVVDVKEQALTVIEMAKKLIFEVQNFLKGLISTKK